MNLNAPLQSPVLPIALYPWGGDYRPAAWAQLGLDAAAAHILLWCEEDDRDKPRYTQLNDPVYTESCLEAFVNFYPAQSKLYLNFENNRAGAMLIQRGTERGGRCFLTPADIPSAEFPHTEAFEHAKGWGVRVTVPRSFVKAVYGTEAEIDPETMIANFYKCSEIADREHYGCWSGIDAPKPDFHRPEFFRAFWRG